MVHNSAFFLFKNACNLSSKSKRKTGMLIELSLTLTSCKLQHCSAGEKCLMPNTVNIIQKLAENNAKNRNKKWIFLDYDRYMPIILVILEWFCYIVFGKFE